jgi:hypothetical protein
MIMHPELEDDLRVRAHAIIRCWLRGDVEGSSPWQATMLMSCCQW